MNKATLTIAGVSLLAGTAAGAFIMRPAQGPTTAVQMPPSDERNFEAKVQNTEAAIASPFAVIEVRDNAGIDSNVATGTRENSAAIDYTQLSDFNYLLATLHHISDADESLILQWIEKAPALSHAPSASRNVNKALFQKLSELQPSLTVDWIERRSGNMRTLVQDVLLNDAIAGYSIAQPEAAEKWLASLDPYGPQQSLVYSFTTTLARTNPERMLAQLSTPNEQGYAYEIVNTWAQTNPESALGWLESRATNTEKEMYETTIIESLMQLNPEAALAYLQNSPRKENSSWLLTQYASNLARQDPLKALDWAFTQSDPSVLEQTISELIWVLPQTELGDIQARIEGLDDHEMKDRIMLNTASRFLSDMAESDPASAMAWIDSQSANIQEELRPQAVSTWLRSDPTSAIDWLRQQPDSLESTHLLQSLMWELPTIDIDLALETFPSLSKNEKMNFIGPMITAIRKDRPSMLHQWVSGLDDADTQKMASIILEDQAQLGNPEQFLAELDQATGEERIEKLAVLYRSMGTGDTTQFEQWFAENPLSSAEEMALERKLEEMYPVFGEQC